MEICLLQAFMSCIAAQLTCNTACAFQLRASLQGLKGIEAAKGNRLGAFGAVKLCELITANMRSFQRPPIGPLGAYISVTDGRCGRSAHRLLSVHACPLCVRKHGFPSPGPGPHPP